MWEAEYPNWVECTITFQEDVKVAIDTARSTRVYPHRNWAVIKAGEYRGVMECLSLAYSYRGFVYIPIGNGWIRVTISQTGITPAQATWAGGVQGLTLTGQLVTTPTFDMQYLLRYHSSVNTTGDLYVNIDGEFDMADHSLYLDESNLTVEGRLSTTTIGIQTSSVKVSISWWVKETLISQTPIASPCGWSRDGFTGKTWEELSSEHYATSSSPKVAAWAGSGGDGSVFLKKTNDLCIWFSYRESQFAADRGSQFLTIYETSSYAEVYDAGSGFPVNYSSGPLVVYRKVPAFTNTHHFNQLTFFPNEVDGTPAFTMFPYIRWANWWEDIRYDMGGSTKQVRGVLPGTDPGKGYYGQEGSYMVYGDGYHDFTYGETPGNYPLWGTVDWLSSSSSGERRNVTYSTTKVPLTTIDLVAGVATYEFIDDSGWYNDITVTLNCTVFSQEELDADPGYGGRRHYFVYNKEFTSTTMTPDKIEYDEDKLETIVHLDADFDFIQRQLDPQRPGTTANTQLFQWTKPHYHFDFDTDEEIEVSTTLTGPAAWSNPTINFTLKTHSVY